MERAVEVAIRARLMAAPAVIALVPATSILDVNQRPAPLPSIILGESQAVDEGTSLARAHVRVFHTIHVWMRAPSLESVKTACAAIRAAIHAGRLDLGPGLHCADARVSSMRQLRDPDGETAHGVVSVEILVSEVSP